MIKMDNLSLPAPAACTVEITGRAGYEKYNTLGQLVADGRVDKRQLDMRWVRMELTVLQQLFSLLDSQPFFTLTYPDPAAGTRSIVCRTVSRSARVLHYQGQAAWADVCLKLEER